jgi:preprotein translocase subunit SecY
MLQSLRQAFGLPDLRRKLLYTLGILAVFRLAAHVPVPGLNRSALDTFFNSQGAGADAARLINMLSGGALENFSVVAMGVYPYITASIIIQLMTPLIPALEELQKEGESGRNTINLYTYWLTIPLSLLQAVAQVALLNSSSSGGTGGAILAFGADHPLNTATVLFALTAGTMFSLWLGERISEQGIGNGVSIIIFGGIITQVPQNLQTLIQQPLGLMIMLVLTALTVGLIVVVQEGHRRIPVQYGRRVRGTKVYGGQSTYIPLRVNSAGMIPLIFANALMIFPTMIGGLLANASQPNLSAIGDKLAVWFAPGSSAIYYGFYFLLVVAFTFFYTDVVFRQQNLHETLQRNGGFVAGIRPGKRTEDYLNFIMHRITFVGAVFLGLVAVLPFLVSKITNLPATSSLLIDATGLLIVVGVVLDTIKQLEAQLLMRHYEGFIK